MSQQRKFIKTERRTFLKGAAILGGTAAVVPTAVVAAEPVHLDEAEQSLHKGYEENDYIRQYYKRARF